MADLYHSGAVSAAVDIGFRGRIVGAVGMALGSLLCGFQLAPVSGEKGILTGFNLTIGRCVT